MKETMLLYVEAGEADPSKLTFFLVNQRHRWMTYDDRQIKIAEDVEVEFEPPQMTEKELRLKAVEQLRERQLQVRAEAQKRIGDIDEQINKLLLIEYKPELRVVGDDGHIQF